MSTRTTLPVTTLVVALFVAACSSGSSGGAPAGASSPPAATESLISGIAHPTGAEEIVLRVDESGGFVPMEFIAAHVPQFTLYGDGTVVFTSSSAVPADRGDGVTLSTPLRTTKLTEEQVQSLLEVALRDGGLGAARAEYQNPLVADAPTTVFTINADGASKTVSVVALGMEDQEANADTAIKKALAELGTRLKDFDPDGSQSEPYVATAYEGVLTKQDGLEGVQVRDWPWTDLSPADFAVPNDPNQLPQGRAPLTPAQAEALGIDGFESGIVMGVYLRDDAGKVYSFSLRPLLPEGQVTTS
ncbi:MAG TPA: hypothetical protein VFL03_07450 [Candidatus Limnocylindrales bacterium]|nr:hypothetical protein [Candidatus Limnocylindrales bacterium]